MPQFLNRKVLGQLRKSQKILLLSVGVVTSITIVVAVAADAISGIHDFIADQKHTYLISKTLLDSDVRAGEANFRTGLASAELVWASYDKVSPMFIEQFYRDGQLLLMQPGPDMRAHLVIGVPGEPPDPDYLLRYLALSAQLSRTSVATALAQGRELYGYFHSTTHNLLTIVPAPSAAELPARSNIRRLMDTLRIDPGELVPPPGSSAFSERRRIRWLPPFTDPLSGTKVVRMAAAAFSGNRPFAIIVVNRTPDALIAPVNAAGSIGAFAIVGPGGQVIATRPSRSNDPSLIDAAVHAVALRNASTGDESHEYRGIFTFSDSLGDTGWSLAYAFSWRTIIAGVSGKVLVDVFTAAAILSIFWMLIFAVNRRVLTPILEQSQRVFESEHLSRTLIETAPAGLALISTQTGHPLLGNTMMTDMAKRLITPGRTLAAEFVRHFAAHVAADPDARLTGITRGEIRLPTRDGDHVDLAVNTAASRYKGHDVIVSAFTDDTDRNRLEQQLRDAMEEADSANAAKSAFLAMMSHEIRTPLNAIMGNLELLSHSRLDALQRDRLKTIRTSSDGLLGIISNVLDFSKIEAGEMILERIGFDAQEVASRALTMFGSLARAKGVRLAGRFGTSTTQPMQGDPTRLGQVMNNLLSNALKFTGRGEVTLGLSVQSGQADAGGRLVIEVEDSGIGMSTEQQAMLFQMFSQADATINRRYGGTGLGLALSARLTDAMGGTIAVCSEPGKGSLFTVRVPLGECEGGEGPQMPRFSGELVLFVAQAQAWHAYAVAALQAWGLRVQAYRHPAQVDLATLEEADTLILCGERESWHADDERGLLEESSWMIDCSTEGPAYPVARGRVVSVSTYGLKGLATALRYTLQNEPLETGGETQRVLSRPLKVLVAEDNEVNRQLFEEQLKLLGCEAHVAADGQRALERPSRERFDVLVTDLAMPVLDGYALAREVRARWPEMPIMAATASATLEERTRCEAVGISRVVTKPLHLDELLSALSEVTGVPGVAVEAGGQAGRRDDVLGGRAVPEYLRATFLRSCEAALGVIRTAYDGDDAARLLAELHSLRGMLGVFGYGALAEQYAELESRVSRDGLTAIGKPDFTLTTLE